MFSTLRTRFGIPGVISVIALVFAMFGGAYAASNSASGGKATASKAKAKRGPRGPRGATGPAGPAGPQGPAGTNGKDGANGSNGAPGANGKSVTVAQEASGCPEGGITVEVQGSGEENEVCNGEPGVIHPGETLPAGATETGPWLLATGSAVAPMPFNIPLAHELPAASVHYVAKNVQEGKIGSGSGEACEGKSGAELTACEGEFTTVRAACSGTAAAPEAASGHLCVYEESMLAFGPEPDSSVISNNANGGPLPLPGASVAGATIVVSGFEGIGYGTWAVTG